MKNRSKIVRALLVPLAAALGGCVSPWQDHYQGAPRGAYGATEDVTVREVPWERVDAALASIEAGRAASDVHWDEWTGEQKMDEQAALVRALQISEDPRDLIVLGRSVFRSTDDLRPNDGSLAGFARSIGADYAVWSEHFVGIKKVASSERVYESGTRTRTYTDSMGNRRREYEPWDKTVFVPVVVDADEHAWVVYFLRRR